MRGPQLTHWVNLDGDTVCHLQCAIEEQRRLRKEVARLREALACAHCETAEIARLQERLRYEEERNEANVALADREIARLRQAIWDWYDSLHGSPDETAAEAVLCDIALEGE